MPECLVALGSNLGQKTNQLDRAVNRLAEMDGTRVLARSGWISSRPVGGPLGQGGFANGVVRISTGADPHELLAATQAIERQVGSKRATVRWAARELDIDILLYGSKQVTTPQLTIPHPRMCVRRFVLGPAAQIAADWVHPGCGWTIRGLFQNLSREPYFAVASPCPQMIRDFVNLLPDEVRIIHDACGEVAAGRLADPSLELRRQRVALVDRCRFRKPTLTSFWVHQPRLHRGGDLTDAMIRQKLACDLRSRTDPKLLVVLDAPAEWLEASHEATGDLLTASAWKERRTRFWRAVRKQNCAPLLELDIRDFDWARMQFLAAIKGMQ